MRGYTDLTGRGAVVRIEGALVRLSGADVETWLQGQVTNDLRRLVGRSFLDACLTKATGQLEAVVRVWKDDVAWILQTSDLAVLERRISDFVILEDVVLDVLSTEVWTWQSPVPVPGDRPSPRTGPFGSDLATRPADVPEADVEAWRTVCLEQGLPVVGSDTDSKTLPPELGVRFEKAHVAYDKGCYVGQEVLQRIHSRGHTNRTWVVLSCGADVLPGSDVVQDGAKVGNVTRSCTSPRFGALAGAMLANRATETGTVLSVGDVPARVVDPPGLVL
ncbi:MAG: hypothetical protein JST30_08600 [Armatimonadetes bacterium]|nr:hypothetical protein [Armatimonadota bacterium]